MYNFSIIIPVYNRPDEVDELLLSLTRQTDSNFEVIIVEDGSTIKCDDICKKYEHLLDLSYLSKENSGPGQSRNYGAERSKGNYLIILDSDVVVPPKYIATVRQELNSNPCDAFGGPDAADDSFSDMQKAVNYAMTSFFTTGGIRGGNRQLEKFHPRSFNLGISKEVFVALGGFSQMRYGEDIDLSIRIYKAGYSVRLLNEAFVFHKRRTNIEQFFNQVHHSGNARIVLSEKHKDYPGSLKLVHYLPAVFTAASIVCLFLSIFNSAFMMPIIIFALVVLIDSSNKNKSIKIGALSVATSFTQLFGYGIGFIEQLIKTKIEKRQQS